MPRTDSRDLERSCARNRVTVGASRPGFERMEADFADHAFAPHRHDTYTIGITTRGVQLFRYRGQQRQSLAGNVFVLHPDELHDGRPGAAAGFRYRALYVEPRLIQAALATSRYSLPFVPALSTDPGLHAAIETVLQDIDLPLEDLQFDQILAQLAGALSAADRSRVLLPADPPRLRAVARARDYLDENLFGPVASSALEELTGLSRFALARHFRACFGTSPYRYVVMRRLDHARRLIRSDASLAAAATGSGFADQSHMTRHFKRAYGLSPGRWRRLATVSRQLVPR